MTQAKCVRHALQTYLKCFQICHPWVRVHCQKYPQLVPQLAERIQIFLWREAWQHRRIQNAGAGAGTPKAGEGAPTAGAGAAPKAEGTGAPSTGADAPKGAGAAAPKAVGAPADLPPNPIGAGAGLPNPPNPIAGAVLPNAPTPNPPADCCVRDPSPRLPCE
jgi:hypothetical protein